MELQLELNGTAVEDPSDGRAVMVTPPIGRDYWLARVPVGGNQALVCFPKFSTVGIGFQEEADWNANLPFSCPAAEIYDHIKHNRGSCRARRADCLKAIQMLREFAAGFLGRDLGKAEARMVRESRRRQ